MLRIPCPHCGLRDEPEFDFGGPAHVTRPAWEVSDEEWTAYLYLRENPAGLHLERWCHSSGCGRWFNVARDTLTHEVIRSYPIGAPKPELSSLASRRRIL